MNDIDAGYFKDIDGGYLMVIPYSAWASGEVFCVTEYDEQGTEMDVEIAYGLDDLKTMHPHMELLDLGKCANLQDYLAGSAEEDRGAQIGGDAEEPTGMCGLVQDLEAMHDMVNSVVEQEEQMQRTHGAGEVELT